MKKNKISIFRILVAIMFFMAGFLSGKFVFYKPLPQSPDIIAKDITSLVRPDTKDIEVDDSSQDYSVDEKKDDEDKTNKEQGLSEIEIINIIDGSFLSYSDGEIKIEFDDGSGNMIIGRVSIPDDLDIEYKKYKDVDFYEEELEQYNNSIKETDDEANKKEGFAEDYPLSYEVISVEPEDLKVGDRLIVFTKGDINKDDVLIAESVEFETLPVANDAEQVIGREISLPDAPIIESDTDTDNSNIDLSTFGREITKPDAPIIEPEK